MTLHTVTYALHIRCTPLDVWKALTEDAFIQQYWGGEWRMDSTWTAGAPLHIYMRDGKLYSTGTVLEAVPGEKLVHTWPEPDAPADATHERLTWTIVPSGHGTVKLALLHENISEKYAGSVREGWTSILSSFKSMLETGQVLSFFERQPQTEGASHG
jgi:uncharacterized protein YndB with AHSA1/START domain